MGDPDNRPNAGGMRACAGLWAPTTRHGLTRSCERKSDARAPLRYDYQVPSNMKLIHSDVLVVDDQISLVEQARNALEPIFGAIVCFADPVKAAHHLRSGETYKAMLIDVQMEPVSGLAILKLARQLNPEVQVVMISGHASTDTAIKALQLGACDYLLKPVMDWNIVVHAVKRAVEAWDLRHENDRLMRELTLRNDELGRTVALFRRLNETAEMMHAARDLKQILNILLKSACQYLDARRVSIMIRDPMHGEMGIQVAEGLDEAVIKQVRVRLNEGIAGRVIASKRAIVVADAGADASVPKRDRTKPYRGRSFMSIPIAMGGREHGGDKVIGVVNVTDRTDDRPFSPYEVEFVTHLARQAALALGGAAVWQTIANLAAE